MMRLKTIWILMCIPCLVRAQDPIRFDTQRQWLKWELPLGAVEVDRRGVVRPVHVSRDINAVRSAEAFGGGIRMVGSNGHTSRFVMDGLESTGWAPDPDDPPGDWFIEIDLGRAVSATEVTFVFDQEAPPFEIFDLFLSAGEPILNSGNTGIEGTLVYRIKERVAENREHRITYAPGELLDYTAIEVVRLQVLKFEPGARLVEVEVKAVGDNVMLHVAPNSGSYSLIKDVDVSQVEIRQANVAPLLDGSIYNRYIDKLEMRGLSHDVWTELTVDLGAVYWLDLVRLIGWTALRPSTQHQSDNIASQWQRNSLESTGGRDFKLKTYEVLTSDGTLTPDGSYRYTRHFSGQRTSENERLGIADVHFDLIPARHVLIRWLSWDTACAAALAGVGVGEGQGLGVAYGACYAHGTGDEYQVFGEGYPAQVELRSGPIILGSDKNLTSVSWEADTPLGTEVEIRSRTGNEMIVDTTAYYDDKDRVITRRKWDTLKKRDRHGRVETVSRPGPTWSQWSSKYTASGERFKSPSPRRNLELSVRLVSDSPLGAAALDELTVEFTPPLADSAFGEIFPTRVQPAQMTEFSYYVRPMGRNTRFERLSLEAPSPLHFKEVLVRDAPQEVEVDSAAAERFEITFTEPIRRNQLVEVRFEAAVFVASSRFEGFLGAVRNGEMVSQQVDPGDATELVEGNTDVVALPVGGRLLSGVQVEPRVLTPNGDGINDELTVTLDLVSVFAPRSLHLRVFDLTGHLVYEEEREAVAGPQDFDWDGRADGRLVAPGLYIVELHIAGDAREQSAHTLLPIVY